MEDNITETRQLLNELNALVNINFEERARLQNRNAGHSNAVISNNQPEQNSANLARQSKRDRLSLTRRNAHTVRNFYCI